MMRLRAARISWQARREREEAEELGVLLAGHVTPKRADRMIREQRVIVSQLSRVPQGMGRIIGRA